MPTQDVKALQQAGFDVIKEEQGARVDACPCVQGWTAAPRGESAHVTAGAFHLQPSLCVVTGNQERTAAGVSNKPGQKNGLSAGHGGHVVLSHARQMHLGRQGPAARRKGKLKPGHGAVPVPA